MATKLRKTGIEVLGDIPWGTHFCHFYETKQDLLDTLVPYFKAGLENGEFCLWVISAPLKEEEARKSLRKAVPELDRYLAEHQIEIVSSLEWYLKDGRFDPERVISDWNTKLKQALASGYAGMRVNGHETWLKKKDYNYYLEYEKELNHSITGMRMIVMCTFPVAMCGSSAILDVAHTHQFVVALRKGVWEVIETSELKQAKAEIERLNGELEQRVVERTQELTETNEALRREIIERERAEQSLRQLQQQTESILAGVADIYIVVDRQWRYYYVNEAAVRFLGLSREQILGRTLWELFPDLVGTELERQFHRTMDERIAVSFDFYYSTSDAWWETRSYPSPEGLSVFSTNITQRKKAEEALLESEKRFRSSFELGLIGMAITSPSKGCIEVNDELCEILGYERSELLQMNWAEITHPDDLPADIANFKRVLAGEIDGYSMNKRYIRKDGQVIDSIISVKCLRRADGLVDYFMGHVQDITERKRAEEKIIAYQEQLRSMAAEISFVEERERHKIATSLHDQVGQTLAMASIKLGALRQAVDPGNLGGQVDGIREMITHAIRSSRTLTIELSPPILYELGLEAAVSSIAEHYGKEHGIRIDCRDDRQPKPLSDDMRILLFQGVRELLVNAVKHAHPQRITISCRREGTDIVVEVEDDGVGFAIADRETLTGKTHGFGLFSMSERLKYLGGSIAIKSAPVRGTHVTLTAPLLIKPEENGGAE